MTTPETLTPKSTEASIRVPALLNLFPGLEKLLPNIPGLENLAGLKLQPDDRWDKDRKTDDFNLYTPDGTFVAHFRFLNFRQLWLDGKPIRHDVILDIGWKDNKGRPLLVTYASPKRENPRPYLSQIWVGPLGQEKIIIVLDHEIRGNPNLQIEEIFLNRAEHCTGIRVEVDQPEKPHFSGLIALRDSVKTTYDQKNGLFTLTGQAPFFSKPFSLLTLPVKLECNAPYLTP